MTHPAQLTDPAAIREFVLAGNARITLASRKTGARFTYRVRRPKDGDGPVSHFVDVLSGPENEADYAYLGHYRDGRFSHGRKSKVGADAPSARAWRWFDTVVILHRRVPQELEVWHEGRCGRCGRVLTVPESIARGIGPECAGLL